jgi:hypothetical protein
MVGKHGLLGIGTSLDVLGAMSCSMDKLRTSKDKLNSVLAVWANRDTL